MFADVAFPQRRYQVFTYRVPARLTAQLQVGSRVLVPLGRSSAQGLVFKVYEDFPAQSVREGLSKHDLREVSGLVDDPKDSTLDPKLIKLASQVGNYYLAPPGAALRLIVPPIASSRIAKRIVLADEGREALGRSKLSADQSTILARLAKTSKGLTIATLLKAIDGNKSAVAGLKRRGLVHEVEWVREVPDKSAGLKVAHLPLTDSMYGRSKGGEAEECTVEKTRLQGWQSQWFTRVCESISSQRNEEFLLHASQPMREPLLVACIRQTVDRDRTALVLCPEVQQVTRIQKLLRRSLGERVVSFHGDLTPRDRSQSWHDIQKGRYDVVIGTRSAVFLPLPSVGLIWVDQEEDSSYQEEQSPHYHTGVVASMRAQLESAALILGSSHPSVETIHRLGHQERHLPKGQETPPIEIVNLQQIPYGTVLSDPMVEGMRRVLEAKGRIVLFLNRKGFSRSLTCKDCGFVSQCTKCGVALILYQKPLRMVCSYCGQNHIPPAMCPSCQSVRLEAAGYGTERLEAMVKQQFPGASVARFDRETIKTNSKESETLQAFQNRTISILIGTELLSHTESLPPVQFIGIPNADSGLHFPDFRAAERTYHRLMNAMRLIDENASSHIVIQTLLPTHHVIRAVAQRDPIVFYQEELGIRRALNYPPYSRLIHIAISGKYSDRVKQVAIRCRERILEAEQHELSRTAHVRIPDEGTETMLGPLLSQQVKKPGLTRYVVILKGRDDVRVRCLVKSMQENFADVLRRERMMMEVKVDPADMN